MPPAMLLLFYSLKRQGSYLADLLLDFNHVFMKEIARGESSDKVSKSPGEGFPKTADGQSSNVLGPSHSVELGLPRGSSLGQSSLLRLMESKAEAAACR